MPLRSHNRRATLLALTAAMAAAIAAAIPAHAGAPVPVLLQDGQASTTDFFPTLQTDAAVQPHTQVEPSIAVNPTNPKNVVAGFQVGRVAGGGDADNGVAATLDGGQTWHDQLLPGLTKDGPRPPAAPFDRASDAVVAFGPDGTVYANSLVFDDTTGQGLRSAMAVNVSYDRGLTWSDGVILEQDVVGGLNDKNWIIVDQSDAPDHHKGRVFVVWDRIDPMIYAYCDAKCEVLTNWSSAVTNPATHQANGFYTFYPGPGIGAQPLIQTNGDLTIVFLSDVQGSPVIIRPGEQPEVDPNGSTILQTTTTTGNGRSNFPAPLTFPQVNAITVGTYNSSGVQGQRAGGLPTATIDPTSNQIYVGWEDSTARTVDGRNDAVFATSKDGGVTWTAKKRIDFNADGSYIDAYNTALSVGGDGMLRAMYRQRSEPASGPPSNTIDTYYQQLSDGGTNWSAPLRVDVGAVTDARYGAFSRGGLFEGDYNQIATGSDGVAWIVREEAYAPSPGATCSCTFTGPPNVHENQYTWVASIAPTDAPINMPDAPWVPALALLGVGVVAVALGRRRSRPTVGD